MSEKEKAILGKEREVSETEQAASGKHRALENIVVLDLARVVAGPFSSSILADLGAKVIKVEIPGKGDDARSYGPYVNGESLYYSNLNRNKYGITLNLKTEEGRQIIRELVKKADILIENFRPGVMERLGLGYEDLKKINDQLIYGAVSGFGSYGKYAGRPGYDIIAQAMGGLMSLTGQQGDPPTRAGCAMGDILGGLNLTIGVLAALNARTVTGHGQRVDVALTDCVISSLEQAIQRYEVSGQLPERVGNSYAAIAPYDTYEAKDGHLVIGCGTQKMFETLFRDLIRKPEVIEDPRFADIPDRVKNNLILKEIIEEWTKQYTVKEAVDIILNAGIPAGPIYDLSDIMTDENFTVDREMIVKTHHPVMGDIILNGNPVKLLDTMPEIYKASPLLGEDTETIFGEFLGMTPEDVEALREKGIV